MDLLNGYSNSGRGNLPGFFVNAPNGYSGGERSRVVFKSPGILKKDVSTSSPCAKNVRWSTDLVQKQEILPELHHQVSVNHNPISIYGEPHRTELPDLCTSPNPDMPGDFAPSYLFSHLSRKRRKPCPVPATARPPASPGIIKKRIDESTSSLSPPNHIPPSNSTLNSPLNHSFASGPPLRSLAWPDEPPKKLQKDDAGQAFIADVDRPSLPLNNCKRADANVTTNLTLNSLNTSNMVNLSTNSPQTLTPLSLAAGRVNARPRLTALSRNRMRLLRGEADTSLDVSTIEAKKESFLEKLWNFVAPQ